MLKYYELREGDGNQGTYYKATILARDMQNALNIVRRRNLINLKPYWRRQLEEQGDETHVSLCLYPGPKDNLDYCPFVFDIIEVNEETATYNRATHGA